MAASAYPPPPPFYRLYAASGDGSAGSPPLPPPPLEGSYTLFGAEYTTEDALPGLEEQGVRQLYPKDAKIDVKQELRRLGREIVVEVVELTDSLVQRPSQFARRVEDLGLLFKNAHHLLNSLRPHQARATLIHVLELQIEQRKKAIADIQQRRKEARDLRHVALSDLVKRMQHMDAQDAPSEAQPYMDYGQQHGGAEDMGGGHEAMGMHGLHYQ